MDNFTFIVAAARQQDGLGGHIELTQGQREVFIEVSPAIAGNSKAALSTLAHEVTHKFLDIHAVTLGSTELHHFENEILTDVASVYVGFGCILLNGYETSAAKLGYLTRDRLSVVYLVMHAIQRTPLELIYQGLEDEVAEAVKKTREDIAELLDVGSRAAALAESLLTGTQQAQWRLADMDRELRYVMRACCDPSRKFVNSAHSTLFEINQKAARLMQGIEVAKIRDYLEALLMIREMNDLSTQLGTLTSQANAFTQAFADLVSHVAVSESPFHDPTSGEMARVVCPYGNHDIQLRDALRNKIRCSQCGRDFMVDSTPKARSIPEATPPPINSLRAVKPAGVRPGILQWLLRKRFRNSG